MASRDALLAAQERTTKTCFGGCCDYSEGKPRDAFWDNYKALCAFCVISMHTIVPSSFLAWRSGFFDSKLGRMWIGSSSFIFIFTMPGFCFVTGFYSKTALNRAQCVTLVRYAAAVVINHGFSLLTQTQSDVQSYRNLWEDQHPNLNETNVLLKAEGKPTLSPPGALPLPFFRITGLDWYLFCVIIWRCSLPLLAQLQRPFFLSLVMGVTVMFTDASATVYSNAPFGFLPFFLLGYHAKHRLSDIEKLRKNRIVRALFLLAGAVFLVDPVFDNNMRLYAWVCKPLGCIYGGDSEVGAGFEQNIVDVLNITMAETMKQQHPLPSPATDYCHTAAAVPHVLLFYAVAMAGVLALMAVTPTNRIYLLTRAGTNAIYIYFGQLWALSIYCVGIAVTAYYTGFRQPILPIGLAMFVSFLATFLTWVLLSQPCFKCSCKPCIEPGVERGCLPIVKPEVMA